MQHYFITGTSKGIGKALAEALLKRQDTWVTGIARTSAIVHERYTHHELDLSDTVHLRSRISLIFQIADQVRKIVLINNAATLGEVAYIGRQTDKNIETLVDVNITSPAILMNAFVRTFQNAHMEKVILNVSSGAGRKPSDGWSMYCSSKAALDMMTEVAAKEEKLNPRGFYFFSIAPGVVDTLMQENLRHASDNEFSRKNEFLNYKDGGMLSSPEDVAEQLLSISDQPKEQKETIFTIKGRR
jgi:benzil reductase ((S)-benzoin forming)